MGLMDAIFRKPLESPGPAIKTAEEMGLKEIEALLASSEQRELLRLKGVVEKYRADMATRLGRLDAALKILEEEKFEEDMHPRLKKILMGNRSNMTVRIRRMMRSLAAAPSGDVGSMERYFDGSLIEVSKAVSDTDISRRRLSEFMGESVSKVAQNVNRVADLATSQTTEASEIVEKIRTIEGLSEKSGALVAARSEAAKVLKEIEDIREKMASLGSRREAAEKSLSSIYQSGKYIELKTLEKERKEVERLLRENSDGLSSRLGALNKPLRKLLHLSGDSDAIDRLIGPPESIDEMVSALREVMPSLKAAVEDGSIELKEDVREKVLGKINGLLGGDVLDTFLGEKARLEGETRRLDERIKELDTEGHRELESGLEAMKASILDGNKQLAEAGDSLSRISARAGTIRSELERGLLGLGMEINVSDLGEAPEARP